MDTSHSAALFTAKPSLYEFYNRLFEGVVADTQALQDECFILRHQVYCVEHTFLPLSMWERECDEHEDASVHGLLQHRPSQSYIGTVRLIPQRTEQYAKTTPVYQLCAAADLKLPPEYTPESTAEISRLAISKAFRHRIVDSFHAASYTEAELVADRRRIVPCIALGLMTMANVLARQAGIDKYCAVMDPSLLRMLAKLSINFHPLGSPIEYHGLRQICYITTDEIRQDVTKNRPDVLEVLTQGGRYP